MKPVFKVVKIISEYKLVINGGSNNNLSRDQILEVFVPGEEIFDPDTKQSLGTLDTVKCYLIVVDVLPQMCVCENLATTVTSLLEIRSTLEKRQTLPVLTSEITGGLTSDRKIKIGDMVRPSH